MEDKRSGPPSYVSSPPSYTSYPPSNNGAAYSSSGLPTQPGYPGPPAHPGYPPTVVTQTAYVEPYPGVAPAVTVTQQPMTNIIVVQPAAGTAVPDSYLVWSILTCLFCCWPLGLVAIVFSCISRGDAESGRFEDARQKGRVAMWLSVAAFVVGLGFLTILIVINSQ